MRPHEASNFIAFLNTSFIVQENGIYWKIKTFKCGFFTVISMEILIEWHKIRFFFSKIR